jgi:hypothetical protein
MVRLKIRHTMLEQSEQDFIAFWEIGQVLQGILYGID